MILGRQLKEELLVGDEFHGGTRIMVVRRIEGLRNEKPNG